MDSKIGIRFWPFNAILYSGWTLEFYSNDCGITVLSMDAYSLKFANARPHRRMDKYRK